VVVPDYQLSLAIGREGQNARLAARLTGWRIDIKSETQFAEEQRAFQEAFDAGLIDEYGNPLSDEGAKAIEAAYESAEAVRRSALEDEDDDVLSAEPDATATDLPVGAAADAVIADPSEVVEVAEPAIAPPVTEPEPRPDAGTDAAPAAADDPSTTP
jgi:hypothetical protein